ncbi:hypothetical protein DICVIV_12610 [Dictyocaulus viviparus]|uniref:Protein transport protein sec16 n=1 Tax=Dictyocaulus viviparus TaxID=29172 RepID=A0A0D8XA25_DICVI|nr:hypothetical protein DICVIV_12610 [Dictyocaulus viviparus]
MFSHGGPSVDRSFDLNPTVIYGDDFVDAARRTRRARPSRPNSCAKSEVGESGLSRRQFDHGSFAISLPSDYAKHYPSGRRSVHTLLGTTNVYDYNGQQAHMYKERRRPQSSFDPRSMERFQRYGGRYGSYDAYDEAHSSVSDEVNSDDVERDSEEEIRKYTQKGRCSVPREIFDKETVGEEMYYFGAIHLDQFRVRSILHHFPPPMEYYRLPPIEKAAYLFFVAVYKKRYNDVGDFHRKFNREYYKYICEGDSDNIALWKICKSMQDEYHLKRLEESQKAYEASQRQLFSDDRDSVDGMSDRASMDDNHDDHTSDILSVDSSQRGCVLHPSTPLKHRVPHAFVTFGPGGKMLTVHPDSSVSVVHIDDIKSVITDLHGMKLIESVQSFKGPLLIGQTPTHSVRLYIERQIKQIRFYERESEKPCSNDVIDCLLIWQLLGIIVQQQGRVTGPDVARLLVEVGSVSSKTYVPANQHHSHREKNVAPIDSLTTPIGPVRNAAIMDAPIDSAIRDGLYADAIVLARRLLSHDIAKLLEIEERFIATRPQCNPVVTLVSVSSKKLVPILINPTADGPGSWRTHAAIILANLTSSEAMETVRVCDLGKALAKRDFNCAADFCFLAVAVLAGINPFKPVSVVSAECDSRQHITLIHASLPNHDALQCRYGFLLTDLHATEIFDYAMRLSDTNAHSPLAECVEYHRKRVQYAHLIADFGGFTLDAFRYCMEVARTIWNNHHLFSDDELVDICNLADQLRYGAAVSEYESSWITSLRAMIRQRRQVHHDAEAHQSYPPNVQHPSLSSQVSVPLKTTTEQYIPNPDATENNNSGDSQREVSSARRSQSDSFADEARDWHAQRQDPLEMNPLAQHSSCADADIEDNEENVSRSQTQSTASHHGYTSNDREQGPETFTISTTSPNSRAYGQTRSDEPFLTSDDTSVQSTTEGSPVRTLNHPFEDLSWAQQSKTESQYTSQISAPNSLSHTTHSHQSQIHSGGNSVSANPTSGSADCSIKKTASTNGSKGFFGNMKEKLMKAIPSGNEMILPDDSKPTIIWDPVKGRYVGTGVEEDTTSVPPPKTDVPQSLPNSGGLRAARTSGGSRYFNPLNQISLTNGPNSQPVAPIPIMQIPTTFGFIPSMPPDDSGESVDPFSGQANPTVHGVELTSVAQ